MMMVEMIVIMGEIHLSNRYSLGKGDDLYSLKWYKDEVEFYRLIIITIIITIFLIAFVFVFVICIFNYNYYKDEVEFYWLVIMISNCHQLSSIENIEQSRI